MVPILILAAGGSTRMAPRDKLTEMVEGQPLLCRTARRALATEAPVLVVLPPDRPDRDRAVEGLDLIRVLAVEAAQGMTASLRAGLAALPPGATGVMVLPADMPDLDTPDLRRLLEGFAAEPARILRGAGQDGTPGHPVIFPADLFPELMALAGDEGGRSVIARHRGRLRLVPLPGDRALVDLDTPEDWAAWRARQG